MVDKLMQEWLEEFRAKDRTGWVLVEVDLEDDEFVSLQKAATSLGMTIEEYCNYALYQMINDDSRCVTCKRARLDKSQQCVYCGEID